MTKRYCEGIDCTWCQEKSEPCIYKVANELQAENEKLKKVNNQVKLKLDEIMTENYTNADIFKPFEIIDECRNILST